MTSTTTSKSLLWIPEDHFWHILIRMCTMFWLRTEVSIPACVCQVQLPFHIRHMQSLCIASIKTFLFLLWVSMSRATIQQWLYLSLLVVFENFCNFWQCYPCLNFLHFDINIRTAHPPSYIPEICVQLWAIDWSLSNTNLLAEGHWTLVSFTLTTKQVLFFLRHDSLLYLFSHVLK